MNGSQTQELALSFGVAEVREQELRRVRLDAFR